MTLVLRTVQMILNNLFQSKEKTLSGICFMNKKS